MGNTTSTHQKGISRVNSKTYGANNENRRPHPSLRVKKKSLELPDLASIILTPLPTLPINIPSPSPSPSPLPLPLNSSASSMNDVLTPLHTPRPRHNQHFRGAPLQYSSTRSFGRSNSVSINIPPPSRPSSFVPEDVHSSIPLALRKAALPYDPAAATATATATTADNARDVCIVWRGPGKHVALMRAADDWKEKREMLYEYVLFVLSLSLPKFGFYKVR